jgi:ABC-2 type transport system permease protein
MSATLLRKLLRDLRIPLLVTVVLLAVFQCLWTKITERITAELMPQLLWLGAGRNVGGEEIEAFMFEGPGKISKALIGGEGISIFRLRDMLTVGYVHPLVIIIFCLWAVGRAAGAIAGELDRGTMELLLAQPLARFRLILTHFCVDLTVIPVITLSVWLGSWLGIRLVGLQEVSGPAAKPIHASMYGPALWNVAALLFAISGYTMWLSSTGRFRNRVLGVAILITLVQFLVNVVGQLWDVVSPLRPYTVFYYYQPQQIILRQRWTVDAGLYFPGSLGYVPLNGVVVLFSVGAIGYALALWTFCRRDLPAPL